MDEMLATHRQARESVLVIVHEFLACFRRGGCAVYAFFEGKQDASFYMNAFQNTVPAEWEIRRWACGSKERVYEVHARLDWNRYPKDAVLFFVDRDLSEYLGEPYNPAPNVYVTDGYSIENDCVTQGVCLRLLQEICGLAELAPQEVDDILRVFEEELHRFHAEVTPIIGWYVCCRRKLLRPCMDNIRMKDVFGVTRARLTVRTPEDCESLTEYCEQICKVTLDGNGRNDVEAESQRLASSGPPKTYIRGKYEIWFLVEFVNGVYEECVDLFASVKRRPKRHVQLGTGNAAEIIGPRANVPDSLATFLGATCGAYVASVAGRN